MTTEPALPTSVAERIGLLADESVRLILTEQQPNGALPASSSFSAYTGYCWLRDGAFIADAISVAGAVEPATRFFDWCSEVLLARRQQIEDIVDAARTGHPAPDDEMLPARFTFDGGDGADEWWDFQLDGYGTWVWAALEHAHRHHLDVSRWAEAITLTVDYLLSSWARPCYDWWEEHSEAVHVSTLGCILAGITAARASGVLEPDRADSVRLAAQSISDAMSSRGIHDGHLVKWLDAQTVDASLLAIIAPLGIVEPTSALGLATVNAIEQQLTVGHGVHRYLEDTYFGGGQWPLLSCFLGLANAAIGRTERARQLLDWSADTATAGLALPEQVGHHLLAPERQSEWVERWGPVATPLLWSHAMFLRLACELGLVETEKGSL